MGIVHDVMQFTNDTLIAYAQNVFTIVATPINNVLVTAGVVSLIFIALNSIFQFTTTSFSVYFHWLVRYALILAFATIWANFELLYNILVTVPEDYVGIVLSSAAVNISQTPNPDIYNPADVGDNIYKAIDEFGNGILWIAGELFKKVKFLKPSSWKYIFIGAAVFIIGIIFIAAAVIIVLIAKVGFTVAIGMAPLAISMLLFPQTRGYFESWLRFAVGFAIVPLLTGAIMSVVIAAALATMGASGEADNVLKIYVPFLLISAAAMFMMFQIPNLASSLAGTTVAAAGAGAALAVKRMATSAVGSMVGKPISMAKNINYIGKNASANGQGRLGAAGTALAAMRVNSQVRQARLANSIPFNSQDRKARLANNSPAGVPQALPAPPKPASSGSGNRPMSEEMRRNMQN